MRVLLDENVPVDIIPILRGRNIEANSVNYLGWKGIQNGDLIKRASESFDLLLTRDKDFHQESVRDYVSESFGIVLLAIPQQAGPAYARVFATLWPVDPSDLVGNVTRLGRIVRPAPRTLT